MLAVSRIVDLNPVIHSERSNSYGISVRKRDMQVSRGELADDVLVQASTGEDDSKPLSSDSDSAVSVTWSVSVPVSASAQDIDPRGIPLPGDSEQASAQSAIVGSPMAVDATDVLDRLPTAATDSAQLEAPLIRDMDVETAVTAVEMRDFTAAAKSVQPTAKREGFAVVPDVTWGEQFLEGHVGT
jgi:hypothetical protein